MWHGQKIVKSIQDGYDSPLTSSALEPSNKLSEDVMSDASSCIQDEDEGITRKPNVFGNVTKTAVSDKKTANDSEVLSANNRFNNYNQGFNDSEERNGSIQINSSWEVVEGSSIIMEIDDSQRQDSIHSQKKNNFKVPPVPVKNFVPESKKSSESLTATFASASRK